MLYLTLGYAVCSNMLAALKGYFGTKERKTILR